MWCQHRKKLFFPSTQIRTCGCTHATSAVKPYVSAFYKISLKPPRCVSSSLTKTANHAANALSNSSSRSSRSSSSSWSSSGSSESSSRSSRSSSTYSWWSKWTILGWTKQGGKKMWFISTVCVRTAFCLQSFLTKFAEKRHLSYRRASLPKWVLCCLTWTCARKEAGKRDRVKS